VDFSARKIHLETMLERDTVKDVALPDPNFQKPITIGAGVVSFLSVLGWYWVFG
jgi:hypothetical protein